MPNSSSPSPDERGNERIQPATMSGMGRPAYSFVRRFEQETARELCVDHHYLLCASQGALRLEADGTAWTLPPARAALITAGHAI
jgi:hypothetical protein